MAFKRALWTSGYTYIRRCEYCSTKVVYTDKQLDYRPWYPNGYVYCPTCRRPLRHTEFSAVHPDGTPVFNTKAEADESLRIGYYKAMNPNYQPYMEHPQTPNNQAAPNDRAAQAPAPAPDQGPDTPTPGAAFCPECGRKYIKGQCNFCPGCGKDRQAQ